MSKAATVNDLFYPAPDSGRFAWPESRYEEDNLPDEMSARGKLAVLVVGCLASWSLVAAPFLIFG